MPGIDIEIIYLAQCITYCQVSQDNDAYDDDVTEKKFVALKSCNIYIRFIMHAFGLVSVGDSSADPPTSFHVMVSTDLVCCIIMLQTKSYNAYGGR